METSAALIRHIPKESDPHPLKDTHPGGKNELMSTRARSGRGCLCCGHSALRGETTVVSPFLATRAWGGKPELTRVMFCDECGFRFFGRGLSDEEAGRYYASYRDVSYL